MRVVATVPVSSVPSSNVTLIANSLVWRAFYERALSATERLVLCIRVFLVGLSSTRSRLVCAREGITGLFSRLHYAVWNCAVSLK